MRKTILLVDDDPAFRRLVGPALERRNKRVIQAGSTAEATDALQQRRPDCVILDHALPDGDGVGWLRAMRGRGDRTRTIVVTSSSLDAATLSTLTEELGVALVVHKPVAASAFAAQVDDHIGGVRHLSESELAIVDDAHIGELRESYGKALPDKVRALASAVHQAKLDPEQPQLLREARQMAHILHGTAGCYGFTRVGDAAARVEDALAMLMGSDAFPGPTWGVVEAAVSDATLASHHRPSTPAPPVPVAAPAVISIARILLVDADPRFIEHLGALARDHLVEVVSARTAAGALEKARRETFDAVLLDQMLEPAGSFSRLARELRELPGYAAVPLAIVSADAKVQSRVAALRAGASLFLAKPLDGADFAAAVQHLGALRWHERPRVLILDDDDAFSAHVAAVLRHDGMLVATLRDPSSVLDALETARPDLLLLDVLMPGLGGYDVCRMLRATLRWHDLPIVFVTGVDDRHARVAAFGAGGDDFVAKPVADAELSARIRVRIERARLFADKVGKDLLTGLMLRRAFTHELSERVAEASRHGRRLSVCLIDVDGFKQVNDDHGHLAGDRVLMTIAKLLTRGFRSEDLRGRWGGEEFILAFPGEAPEVVALALRRVLEELQAIDFRGDDGETFHVTFSAGVACLPQDGVSIEALLRAADRQLYQAKHTGRRKVVSAG